MTKASEDGFSIVEVLIARFLLALVAVALLPALWQGIQYSTQQSAVATATRELNALVDQARESSSCAGLTAVAVSRPVNDGANREFTTSGTVGTCPSATKTVKLVLKAVDTSGTTLATTSAIVYVP